MNISMAGGHFRPRSIQQPHSHKCPCSPISGNDSHTGKQQGHCARCREDLSLLTWVSMQWPSYTLCIVKLLPLSKQRIRSQIQQADPPSSPTPLPPLNTHTHSHGPWLIAGAWAKLTGEGARWMSVLLGGVCVCVRVCVCVCVGRGGGLWFDTAPLPWPASELGPARKLQTFQLGCWCFTAGCFSKPSLPRHTTITLRSSRPVGACLSHSQQACQLNQNLCFHKTFIERCLP